MLICRWFVHVSRCGNSYVGGEPAYPEMVYSLNLISFVFKTQYYSTYEWDMRAHTIFLKDIVEYESDECVCQCRCVKTERVGH